MDLENRKPLVNLSCSLSFGKSALIDCLINPLQEQMEEWKKVANQLDKDHAKGTARGMEHGGYEWHGGGTTVLFLSPKQLGALSVSPGASCRRFSFGGGVVPSVPIAGGTAFYLACNTAEHQVSALWVFSHPS